jgi:2-polyprenyl-3-methyl-5-hydroxy-6-metoxy-1,4-benzoquinol methylase
MDGDREGEWDNWNRGSVLPWYSRSSFYNHANFTRMVLFAMGESHKRSPVNILDYGGGGGQFAVVCKSLFPQASIYTTDISDEALLDEWKPMNRQIPFLSFATDRTTFDVIFLNDVLEHVTDPIKVLKQLKDKLTQQGGFIFIDTPKQFWLYPLTRLLSKSLHRKLLDSTVHASHLQIWTRTSFLQAIQRSGLRLSKYAETTEFTMPADFYLDNMGIQHPAVRWLGRVFYRLAKVIAKNKIMAVLERDRGN